MKKLDCIVFVAWKRMKTIGFGRSKNEKAWVYCVFVWTHIKTIGVERAKSEQAWLYWFCVWKPMTTIGFGSSKGKKVNCIAFLLEHLWKLYVSLESWKVTNIHCLVFFFLTTCENYRFYKVEEWQSLTVLFLLLENIKKL